MGEGAAGGQYAGTGEEPDAGLTILAALPNLQRVNAANHWPWPASDEFATRVNSRVTRGHFDQKAGLA
jgi:hypothetical protein